MRANRMFGSFSVDNIEAAELFYRDTIGMTVSAAGKQGSIWLHGPDGHDALLYPRPGHVPASFTVLNLEVENIEDAVDELAARGVRFERYEGLESDDRGIHHAGDHSVAWFTDPAGNIISMVQR